MRKILLSAASLWILLMCCFFTSCSDQEALPEATISFEEESVTLFQELWNLPGSVQNLPINKIWETDVFSMEVSNNSDRLSVTFTSDVFSIKDVFINGSIAMQAVTNTDGQYCFLFDTDVFYMMALLEDTAENSATAMFSLYDNPESLMLIITIDGVIYKAVYSL